MARDKHSPAAVVHELLATVRDARPLLTNPTAERLEACRARLEGAASALGRLQSSLPSGDRSGDGAVDAQLGALRIEIAGVQILLDSAAAFYTGWMRLAASMFSGYTANGNPAKAETGHRMLVEA